MVALALGFLPLGLLYLAELWSRPGQRWFPLALAGALALGARGVWTTRVPAQPGHVGLWLPIMFAALALLAVAGWLASPWLGWAAGLLALAGVAVWTGGRAGMKRWLPAWVMLLALWIPPPAWEPFIYERVEKVLLTAASHWLHTLAVPHWTSSLGVTLATVSVPREQLFMGTYGLPGVLGAGLLFLLWHRRPLLWVAATLCLAALFFLPGEAARLAWGLASSDRSGTNFFASLGATWVTVGTWLAYFGLLVSVDQLMRFLASPRRRPDLPPEPEPPAWPGVAAVTGLRGVASPVAWGAAAVALCVGAAGAWHTAQQARSANTTVAVTASAVALTLDDWPEWRTFAATNSVARLETPPPALGAWHRQRADLAVAISLTGPLTEAVTPVPFYQAEGWRLTGIVTLPAGPTPPSVTAELLRDELFRGVLWFAVVDGTGRWWEPPAVGHPGARLPAGGYLIQLLAVSTRNPSTAERAEIHALFERTRQVLAAQLSAAPEVRP